jgi:hypothetical protein
MKNVPQKLGVDGEHRDEQAEAGEQQAASTPLTLGNVSSFGVVNRSDQEALTRGHSGEFADSDIPPFGHHLTPGDD